LIFVSNMYIPQQGRNLRWSMQGLKLGGMIKGQQFLPMFLNFNNSYVVGKKVNTFGLLLYEWTWPWGASFGANNQFH
jgi:hypothetical protein